MKAVISFFRLAYSFIVPLAGCVLIHFEDGVRFGPLAALGITVGLFVYHYLQWALIVTEGESDQWKFSWISQVVSIALIGYLVKADWKNWLIEQTLLEAAAFSSGIALLAMYKGAKEQMSPGASPPWFLIFLVFVAPAGALLWKLVPVWANRHEGDSVTEWIFISIAFALSLGGSFLAMKPFVIGSDQLAEPLNKGWKTGFIVVWLILILGVMMWLSGR